MNTNIPTIGRDLFSLETEACNPPLTFQLTQHSLLRVRRKFSFPHVNSNATVINQYECWGASNLNLTEIYLPDVRETDADLIEVLLSFSDGMRKHRDQFHVTPVCGLFDQPLVKRSTLGAETTSFLQDQQNRLSALYPIDSSDINVISGSNLVGSSGIGWFISIKNKSFYQNAG